MLIVLRNALLYNVQFLFQEFDAHFQWNIGRGRTVFRGVIDIVDFQCDVLKAT